MIAKVAPEGAQGVREGFDITVASSKRAKIRHGKARVRDVLRSWALQSRMGADLQDNIELSFKRHSSFDGVGKHLFRLGYLLAYLGQVGELERRAIFVSRSMLACLAL